MTDRLARQEKSSQELLLEARAHVQAALEETKGAATTVRRELSPLELARRHPYVTAGVAVGLGLLVARALSRPRRARDGTVAPPTVVERVAGVVAETAAKRLLAVGEELLIAKLTGR